MKTALPPFSAVLLAGGKSTRMGRDKAGLIIDGQPLWQRQLATLRALAPAQLFISGHPGGRYPGADLPIIFDAQPDLGPIAGLAAALQFAQQPLLLVLAIDLPAMTPAFLRRLLEAATERGQGVVPCSSEGEEPLAAVYPRACRPLVEQWLRGEDRALCGFIREAVRAGLLTGLPTSEKERPLFHNVNQPGDLKG